MDQILSSHLKNDQVVWREQGKQENNQTLFKFSVKRDQGFLSAYDLQPMITTLNLALSPEFKSDLFEISVFSKPLQYATLTDIQYSPAYAACVIFTLGLCGILSSLVRKEKITRKNMDYVALTLLLHLALWLSSTFILTGKPSETYCKFTVLFSVTVLSLQVG
jgi:hypothetical protein